MNLDPVMRGVGQEVMRWLPILVAGAWAVTGVVKVGYGTWLQYEGNGNINRHVPSSTQYMQYADMIERGMGHIRQGLPMTGEGGLGGLGGLAIWAVVPPVGRSNTKAS
jgi:hypothetical protein